MNSFIGSSSVSFMLEKFGITTRSMGIVLGGCLMDHYLTCASGISNAFLDSSDYYYEFKVREEWTTILIWILIFV